MEDNQLRQSLMQEIGNIQNYLTAPTSAIGDWKHIKQSEFISQGLEPPYSQEEMAEYYAKRQEARARINELERELEELEG